MGAQGKVVAAAGARQGARCTAHLTRVVGGVELPEQMLWVEAERIVAEVRHLVLAGGWKHTIVCEHDVRLLPSHGRERTTLANSRLELLVQSQTTRATRHLTTTRTRLTLHDSTRILHTCTVVGRLDLVDEMLQLAGEKDAHLARIVHLARCSCDVRSAQELLVARLQVLDAEGGEVLLEARAKRIA